MQYIYFVILFCCQEDYFVVFDLRFDCRYTVRVRSVSVDGTLGSESTISFRTPSCHGITVKGDVQPDCPTYGELGDKSDPHLRYVIGREVHLDKIRYLRCGSATGKIPVFIWLVNLMQTDAQGQNSHYYLNSFCTRTGLRVKINWLHVFVLNGGAYARVVVSTEAFY